VWCSLWCSRITAQIMAFILGRAFVLIAGASGAYPPAQGCDSAMNAWCEKQTQCKRSFEAAGCASKPLYARYESDASGADKTWRCYSPDALSNDTMEYAGGKCYCSHHEEELTTVQHCCLDPSMPGCSATTVFPHGGTGGGAPENVACFRIPVMTITPSGVLIALAEARLLSCSDGGPKAVAMRRSEDGGSSWSDIEFILRDQSNASRYDGLNLGAVVTTSKGDLVLHIVNGSHSLAVSPSGVLRSLDDGRTWSEVDYSQTGTLSEAGVNMFAGGPGSGVRTESGRLLVPGWYNWCCGQKANSTDTGSALLISDDDGQTWRVGAQLAWHFHENLSPNEADVALTADGTIVLSSRDASKGGYRIIAFSEDEGESFIGAHQALDLPDPTCQGSILAADNGTTLYHLSAGSKKHRENGVLHTSRDGGRSWLPSVVVMSGKFSYSALVEVNSTHLGALYEAFEYEDNLGIVFIALEKQTLWESSQITV